MDKGISVGLTGGQRSGKNTLGMDFAINPKAYEDEFVNIEEGFGNFHTHYMPYPWTYLKSRLLMDRLFIALNTGERNKLFYIDEAHKILNPRLWDKWTKEDTQNLAGIFMDGKNGIVVIISYVAGYEDEPLLGVDKMIRGAFGLKIDITSNYKTIEKRDKIVYDYHHRAAGKESVEKRLRKASKLFKYFDTLEPVI